MQKTNRIHPTMSANQATDTEEALDVRSNSYRKATLEAPHDLDAIAAAARGVQDAGQYTNPALVSNDDRIHKSVWPNPATIIAMDYEDWEKWFQFASTLITTDFGEPIPLSVREALKLPEASTVDIPAVAEAANFLMDILEIKQHPMGIAFENLSIKVPIDEDTKVHTTASVLVDAAKAVTKACGSRREPAMHTICEGISGSVSPGELLLIIGPPGSGCSSLMKVLAGRYNPETTHVAGSLWINGEKQPNCKPKSMHAAQIGYCYEGDTHIPEMTVAETFNFMSKMMMPPRIAKHCNTADLRRKNAEWVRVRESINKHKDSIVAHFLTIDNVMDTIVGDELLRGVSGGQKKRVTVGEVVSMAKTLNFFDGYTKGLDAKTTLNIVQQMKMFASTLDKSLTMIVSQYQASQQVFEEFDKVLVLLKDEDTATSRCVYFGKPDPAALGAYFDSLHFSKPAQWSWPDFLGSIANSVGRNRVRASLADVGDVVRPDSAAEFAVRFNESAHGQELRTAIQAKEHHLEGFPAFCSDGAQEQHALKYQVSAMEQFNVLLAREFKLVFKRKEMLGQRLGQMCVMGVLFGTAWLQVKNDLNGVWQRQSLMNMMVTMAATTAFLSIPSLLNDRAVMYRQTRNNAFRPSLFLLAKTVSDLPFILIESLLLTAILSGLADLQMANEHYLFLFLTFTVAEVTMGALIRSVAACASNNFMAYLYAFLVVQGCNFFNGFLIPKDKIGWHFRWACFVSPPYWVFSSLIMNEFDGLTIDLGNNHTIAGDKFVTDVLKIDYDMDFKWACLGIVAAEACIFTILGMFAMAFVRYDSDSLKLVYHEPEDHRQEKLLSKAQRKVREFVPRIPGVKQLGHLASKVTHAVSTTGTGKPHPNSAAAKAAGKAAEAFLTFSDVCYDVEVPKSDKNPDGQLRLLTNVNGYVKPGMTIALMGTSGAGKTTLLDVLARRKTGGSITGNILVNGHAQESTFSRICGYVEQTDNHETRMTIRESFMFSARLRREPGETQEQLDAAVDAVIHQLKLDKIADAVIGSAESGVGISLEALKRVTIGVELIANPSIIFMDEPTSGLDSSGALTIASVARDIAASGRSVVCTIHQPSQMVFEQFDCLLLMQRGGRTVYFGEIGEGCKNVIDYFEGGGAPKCPANQNPADWMLDCIDDAPDYDWTKQSWEPSPTKDQLVADLGNNASAIVSATAQQLSFESSQVTSMWTQLVLVGQRTTTVLWRDPVTTIGILGAALFPAIITALLFVGNCGDDQDGARYSQTALFCAVVNTPIFFLFLALPGCYAGRAAFYREAESGLYSKVVYAVAQQLCIVPYLLVATILNTTIIYFSVEFNDSTGHYGYFFLVVFKFLLTAWVQGQAIGNLTPAIADGTNAVIGPLMMSMLTCGFLVYSEDLGWWYRWLFYANPMGLSYIMQGVFQNEFEGRTFAGAGSPGTYATGEEILAVYGW